MRPTEDSENGEDEPRDVVRAVARIIGFPADQVNRTSRLHEDLGLDVQDASELIEELEDLYHTHVPARCERSARTIGDIERMLVHPGGDAR